MKHIYKNTEEYNPNKKRKILIVWWYLADMLNNKKLNQIVTELFIRGRRLNTSLVFITILCCLNWTHYFVMKILNKREL